MTFKDLSVGAEFIFYPGVSTFSATCRKWSARCYTWVGANGQTIRSQVGTIKVGVKAV